VSRVVRKQFFKKKQKILKNHKATITDRLAVVFQTILQKLMLKNVWVAPKHLPTLALEQYFQNFFSVRSLVDTVLRYPV